MRINSNRSQPVPLPGADAAAQATTTSAAGDSTAERPVSQVDGYAPSAELVQLTALAQQQPETRADVVRAVTARVAQGYYLTRASAEQTAQAILSAVD
jgi:hypothetical protein